MKILTLNTWGHDGPFVKRWDMLLQELNQLEPDIVCLQEVSEPMLAEKIKKLLGFSSMVTAYHFGLATLTRYSAFLSETLGFECLSPTEHEKRGAIFAGVNMNGKKIIIANTHLSWKVEDKFVRQRQAAELVRAVHKTRLPSLLAGDFNDVPGSAPIKEIEKARYIDLYPLLHPRQKGFTWDNQNPFIQSHSVKFPDREIDFLFADSKFLKLNPIKNCGIVFNRPDPNGIYPSDHYGICAEFET